MSSDNLLSSSSSSNLARTGSAHGAHFAMGEPSKPAGLNNSGPLPLSIDSNSVNNSQVFISDGPAPPPGPAPAFARPSLPSPPPTYASMPQPAMLPPVPQSQLQQGGTNGAQNNREFNEFLKGIQERHSNSVPVVEAVQRAAVQLDRHVQEKKDSTQRMTDFELTVGLLLPEEHMLNGINMIPFSKVEFMDQAGANCTPTLARTKYNGRVYLTNKRLLFLSSNYADEGIQCSTVAEPKRPPGKYVIEKTYRDNSWFFPVHAHDIKHVEIDLGLSSRRQMEIEAEVPCCGFPCVPCCPKLWFIHDALQTPDELQSELRIAVYLPPWGLRHLLVLQVAGIQPSNLREFVRAVESICPGLGQPSGPRS